MVHGDIVFLFQMIETTSDFGTLTFTDCVGMCRSTFRDGRVLFIRDLPIPT